MDEGIFDGLRAEANDAPRDSETKRTIVILAQSTGPVPAPDDVIYFEIDEALREIRSLDTDVHIHLFKTLPSSPSQALTQVQMASASLSCRTEGLEVGRGGLELDADWSIDDRKHPDLKPTTPPFRPRTSQGMQQVRVRVVAGLGARFEYLFDAGTHTWRPEFDEPYLDDGTGQLWHRVTGLFEDDVAGPEPLRTALLEASPESGSFILFSRRRRRIGDL